MGLLAELHRLDDEPFAFLRTGATADGVGDCLDYWMRSLRWAKPAQPVPLTEEAKAGCRRTGRRNRAVVG